MDWNQAKDLFMIGLATVASGFIGMEIRRLRDSVETLNTNVAVILARMSNHEDRIKRLEDQS